MNKKSIYTLVLILGFGFSMSYGIATSTVISDSGIITNNLTILGTCTGCGGGSGNFASYSLFLNETVSGTSGNPGTTAYIATNGSSILSDNLGFNSIIKSNGVIVTNTQSANSALAQVQIGQTSDGKYKVLLNNANNLLVYKNDALLQTITLDYTKNFFTSAQYLCIGISSDGKYIGVYGASHSDTINRIQIYQGA